MLSRTGLSQRRSSLEIVAEILRIAKRGARRTRIVYGANLNFKMLKEYLKKLEDAGLITISNEGSLIRTTEKGYRFLQQFHGLRELYLRRSGFLKEI
jgi:predicted transcriptional regulator